MLPTAGLLADGLARLGEFRRQLVLVPLLDGGLASAELAGLRWIYAFSSPEALTVFAQGRRAGGEWEFQTLYGARLLDEVIPSLRSRCGVVLDAGTEDGRLLPPMRGIVPDRAALETAAETETTPVPNDVASAATSLRAHKGAVA
ncbi:hypothetical protein [Streptomyces nanshensis]|uniref:hypothetical protein n=1 Tax=Streptomyces nanshensis TaxID=518642 RepID=UPI00085CA5CC|nr:hypothetical protein [Streptomyces nanshensis]